MLRYMCYCCLIKIIIRKIKWDKIIIKEYNHIFSPSKKKN